MPEGGHSAQRARAARCHYAFVYYPAWLAFPSWARLPVVPGLATALVTTVALCVATVALGRRGMRVPL